VQRERGGERAREQKKQREQRDGETERDRSSTYDCTCGTYMGLLANEKISGEASQKNKKQNQNLYCTVQTTAQHLIVAAQQRTAQHLLVAAR
jgi:hypothetical protein